MVTDPDNHAVKPIRIKICGITSVADAQQVASAGADAIGLVFYEKSPRAVSIEQAADIAQSVGPYVTVVGLFVNADAQTVHSVLQQVPIHVLQFHGDEAPDFCEQFARPWYRAIRMSPKLQPAEEMARFNGAAGYLFDAWDNSTYGGTGTVFDWQRVPQSTRPIVLAGGLNSDNVAAAITTVQPYGVDVSGGVELAPGQKCPQKVRQFIQTVKAQSRRPEGE